MRKQVYICDHCQQIIGDKKHIITSFGNYSGIAVPPHAPIKSIGDVGSGEWTIKHGLNGRFMHFCNSTCIGRFFSALMKETNEK